MKVVCTFTLCPVSTKCSTIKLVIDFVIPLPNHAKWCSQIRMDKRPVVRPKYPAPQKQLKCYMHMGVAQLVSLSFRL